MADKGYIYAVARIRAHELSLLDGAFMEQLMAAQSEEQCLKLLREKGWGSPEMPAEPMLAGEIQKTWDLMEELVPDMSVFNVFLYERDFHNLKASVKESVIGGEHPGIFVQDGTVPAEIIERCVRERDYSELPERMRDAAAEASDVLLRTRDGQMCDLIIDRAAMEEILSAGKASGSELLSMYGELMAAIGDIKIAARGAFVGKDRDFILKAAAPCDTLDVNKLAEAASRGMGDLEAYLWTTSYADAADQIGTSTAAFECWCDNAIIRRIRPQIHNSFGLDPLAAYVLARQTEIKSVRIILTGKRNEMSAEEIRSRVRETYV